MPIRQLSPHLVNQIAAGEVIERPASVVKELVENSLDAGAKRIDVQIESGGRSLIRIRDDGGGIPVSELPLALAPHATSKISSAEDLEAVRTLGFRGEALASIASISHLSLTSRAAGSPDGAVIEAEGDTVKGPAPAACAPGTVIEVRNLFFNTPARRKFLRSDATEFGHISDFLGRLAMSHPQVGFRLTHNGRQVWELEPGQSAKQRCLSQLGADRKEGFLEFQSDEKGVKLWGLAGVPQIARPTAKQQYCFVNRRFVRDRLLMHALKESYRGLIEPSRHPVAAVFLEVDPAMVDVNVHPTKAEVRFTDTQLIHSQIRAALRTALQQADLMPEVGWKPPAAGFAPAPSLPESFSGFSTPSVSTGGGTSGAPAFRMPQAPSPLPLRPVDLAAFRSDQPPAAAESPVVPAGATVPVLQVHNAYLVTEDENGIVIVDQHALHERMMFEELLGRIRARGRLEAQRLLAPAVVSTTPGRVGGLEALRPLLEQIGIEADPIGPGQVGIQSFPTLLFDRGVDPVEFVSDLLERYEAEGFEPSDEAALHEVLDMMSCKAAVKAGDRLSDQELHELLTRREQVERASNCPHGRPTSIRLTLQDLERHFKRS